MTDNFDPNRVAAELVQSQLERIVAVAMKATKDVSNTLRPRLASTFRQYVDRLLARIIHIEGRARDNRFWMVPHEAGSATAIHGERV